VSPRASALGPARRGLLAALVLAALTPATAGAAGPRPPRLQARAAITLEASTGDVAFALRTRERRPVASATKLMTALLALEKLRLDAILPASSYRPRPVESQIGLRPGERMTVSDLLRGLLVTSANDGAMTLAEGVSGTAARFVARMNERAQELGLRDTHYANPIGLDDPQAYSSALDLALLTRKLRANAFFRETTDLPRATLHSGIHPRTFANRNLLVRRVPFVNGVKTGHTRGAGYVLVGSATQHGVTVISVVLGEPSEAARDRDTLALLGYALARYRSRRLLTAGRALRSVAVAGRDDPVAVTPRRSLSSVVREDASIALTFRLPDELTGPLPTGSVVGSALVRVGGRNAGRVPLVTAAAIPSPLAPDDGGGGLVKPATLALAVLVLAAGLWRLRRRGPRPPDGRAGRTEDRKSA
jgi:D-alanyl-D-alanine carboxypeptidase (penicillin-binding protein 5/6)